MRQDSRLSKFIQINKEMIIIQQGMNINPINIKQSERYWENSQFDDIVAIFKQRGLSIKNSTSISNIITLNITIMKYTTKYVKLK